MTKSDQLLQIATSSPQLIVAMKARINSEWKDLIYREALRMNGALRQILAQGNNSTRNQLTKKFLSFFNNLLVELRRPNGLSGPDSDLHGLSTNFEALLQPWLKIFQSENLTGPFIHSALTSIRVFLNSGMFTDGNYPFSRTFIHDLVFSLAHSRFEPTVLENDEIVMLELIEFLAELAKVTIKATKLVNYSENSIQNDEIIGETFLFQLFDLLFTLLNQNRFSELLRAKAGELVVEQCVQIFSSLKTISSWKDHETGEGRQTRIHFPTIMKPQKPETPKIKDSKSLTPPVQSESIFSINMSNIEAETTDITVVNNDLPTGYNPFTDECGDDELAPDAIEEVMKFRAKIAGISLESSEDSAEEQEEVFDFFTDRLSSHCFREILLFLIKCIDIIDKPGKKPPGSVKAEPVISTKVIPSIKTQTTAMKCLVAIFTDPNSELSHKKSNKKFSEFEAEIFELIGGDLLKKLMAILSLDSTSKHLSSLSQILLIIFTNYRIFLPAQFEFFISTCLEIVSTKPSAGNAGGNAGGNGNVVKFIPRPALTALKTTCLEMLAYFLQDPSFIAQIFVYYECSLDYQNTLELLTKGIAAGMEKSAGNEEIINLSGEILCNFIKTIEASLSKVHSKSEIEDLKGLLDQRRIKMIYSEAAGLFNSNPKEVFPFLQQKGLLNGGEVSPKEIAAFLRRAQGLDKKILGEYLVKPNNIEILREFFSAFKFSESTTIDSALRQVLESFRLPGEAQQIDRIMECFSEIYYPSAKATFSSQDACYILAFSTLMLNTDLHNPQVKHKMTLTDFIRNNRGINDGKDVDEDYLMHLYTSIKTREIVMPEEHGGEEAFASQWNEVQKRSDLRDKIVEFEEVALSPLVCGIVEIVWRPIILSIIPFINQQRPTGEVISDGPLESLRGIASLFEKFQMTDALDALLGNIWSVSNLIPVFSAASGNMIPRYLARLPGFRQVVQLIVDIFRDQGDGLKSSWTNWCRLMIILSESGLIGVDLVITQESILFDSKNEAVSLMALMKMAHEGRQVQPVGKQSFISSLGRFFGNSESISITTPPVVNDEITVNARQFVEQLPILSVLIETIPKIEMKKSFSACIESICGHLKWNLAAGASTGKRISAASSIGLNWTEETLILLTESLISIGLAVDPLKLEEQVFPLVFDTLTRLVLQDPTPPIKLCEHVVIGLGRLLLRLSETDQIENEEKFVGYLKFWCQLSPQLQGFTLEPSLALIGLTFKKMKTSQNLEIWPPLFTILSTASKFETSAPFVLKLLELIASGTFEQFPVDFFTEFIDLLSGTVVGCTVVNFEMKIFDPWCQKEEEVMTRGQLAENALKLYEKVFNLFSSQGSFDTWKNFLVPLESNLSRHVPLHPVKIIRQQSINLLTRLLAQTNFQVGEFAVAPIIFSKILIPLLVDLRLRQENCDEIVARCASLTCKTFLLYLDDLGMPRGQLWKEVLESMLPLVLLGQPSEMLREGILESCKNVLLVMHSSSVGASEDADADVWRVSDVMLGPLIPGWKMEIEMRISGGGGGIIDEDEVIKNEADHDNENIKNEAYHDNENINSETNSKTNSETNCETNSETNCETNSETNSETNCEIVSSQITSSQFTTIIDPIGQPISSPIIRSPADKNCDIDAAFSQPDTFISLDQEDENEKKKNDDDVMNSGFDV